ncbi:hypothetical protein DFR49_3627 [Hephaestia caeni]|uniref:Uncharacterized protein n=1 Tax=Hephaestia caeni TaxID=645617 RepID=A0A397NPY6_9SPHN|nr:hypothetical protein [Hephaestia caeni]RIA37739.1 hypothetical protein DFR49_3627 [Hephaestia caeni]
MSGEMGSVKLSLAGDGLSFEKYISMKQAVAIMRVAAMSADEVASVDDVSAGAKIEQPRMGAQISLSEALSTAEPKTSPETIAVIADWVMSEDEVESISREDVSDRYQDARLSMPGNFHRDFAKAVQKGFLAPMRGNKNRFYVTKTGQALSKKG